MTTEAAGRTTAAEAVRGSGNSSGSGVHGGVGPGVFWRYWTASTVSRLGDQVTAVALPLIAVVTLHASALDVSLITGAAYVAWLLLGLPAGVLVQRLPVRGIQVAMDLVRAAALASIPLAAALGVLGLPQLVVVALLVGFANVLFDVGNSTFLPSIVAEEQLTARNSLFSGSIAATDLAGPSVGGVLVQLVGGTAAMALDAVSYLASAVLLSSLPRAERPSPADAIGRPGMREQIREGWRFVARHPVLARCAAAATAVNFVFGGLLTLSPVFLVRVLDAPPAVVGALMATGGIGSLTGAALTPHLAPRAGSGPALCWAAVVATASVFLLSLAGPGWATLLFAVGNAGFSGGVVVISIVARTYRQTRTPPELLSRVTATVRFVSWGAVPVGALVAGAVASAFGLRTALLLLAVAGVASPAVLLAGPVRRMRDLL
ncbi:MFS transporter [Streptomyces sp. FH025]|uniref:MFS transporter n=1 Tax=Streptomyces sp. FH025 TaxID=2815937 RepID=UPI0027DD7A3E|nr:MFS transporter [Streptomyces sp. FH025]